MHNTTTIRKKKEHSRTDNASIWAHTANTTTYVVVVFNAENNAIALDSDSGAHIALVNVSSCWSVIAPRTCDG